MALQAVPEQHPLDWNLSDRLHKLRTALGLDQERFAIEIGVKPGTYPAWERGGRPSDVVAVARAIADRFGAELGVPDLDLWVLGLDRRQHGGDDPGSTSVVTGR